MYNYFFNKIFILDAGNNGFIWICPAINEDTEGGFTQNLQQVVSKADRIVIGRLRNCILALANSKMSLYDSSIMYAYEESQKYTVSIIPDDMKCSFMLFLI